MIKEYSMFADMFASMIKEYSMFAIIDR